MPKLTVSVLSTLDGFAAGVGGDVFVMPIDLGFDRYNLERMRDADMVLFGASSFRQARDYWPSRADDETAPEVEREISRRYRELGKVVVSDRLTPDQTAPWRDSTEIVRRADAASRLGKLKSGDGRDLICFGSITTWSPLLAHGVVDELHVIIGPGVIGSGLPTFAAPVERSLTLLDVERIVDSQLVALKYRVG